MRPFALLLVVMLLHVAAMVPSRAQPNRASLEVRKGDVLQGALALDAVDDMTMEGWLYSDDTSQLGLPFYLGDGGGNGWGLIMHAGSFGTPGERISAVLGSVAWSATGNSLRLPLRAWVHVALTREKGEWRLYRNGMLVGRGTATPNPPTLYTIIGNAFSGRLDELRIWSVPRREEEIRAAMGRRLTGSEQGLVAYYPMDGEDLGTVTRLRNQASARGDTLDIVPVPGSGGSPRYVANEPPLDGGAGMGVEVAGLPQHFAFLPRDSTGGADVTIRLRSLDPDHEELGLELWRDDQLVSRQSSPADTASELVFRSRIAAGLSQTTLRAVARIHGSWRYVAEAADLVVGDVLLIAGQSNSHPSSVAATFTSPYLRSFGVQTPNLNFAPYDKADTSWGLANGHGFGAPYAGPYLTGLWGIELQRLLMERTGIPICIINGGAGASSIEQNQRDDADPQDGATIYGRTLYRAERSGLREHVRAILWHQGEGNTVDGYAANFRALYEDWRADYPALEQVYLFQIRQGCAAGPHAALRELQRTLPDSFPDLAVMSTVGLPGHDGCHYTKVGYDSMAVWIERLVARDLFGASDTLEVDAPSVDTIFYTTSKRDEIALLFRRRATRILWPDDLFIAGRLRSVAEAIYLDSTAGLVIGHRSSGDTLLLELAGPSDARSITYLPDRLYADTALVYEGPWLRNSRGVGVLSFHQVAIGDPPVSGGSGVAWRGGNQAPVEIVAAGGDELLLRVAEEARPVIELIDLRGQVVAWWRSEEAMRGDRRLRLGELGLRQPPGFYLVRLSAGGRSVSKGALLFAY